MARPAPDPAHCIRAFELMTQGRTLQEIVEILQREGAPIKGRETARRWATAGARAASWLQEQAEGEEEATTREFVRQKYVAFLDNLLARGFDELDKGDGLYKEIAPVMFRFAEAQAKALGAYAPVQVAVSGSAAGFDPTTRAVIEAMEAQAKARDQEVSSSGDTE